MFVIILFKISIEFVVIAIIVNGMIIIELFLFISIDCTPLFIPSIDLIERVCYKHR